jgi:hypothetical protein
MIFYFVLLACVGPSQSNRQLEASSPIRSGQSNDRRSEVCPVEGNKKLATQD